MTNKPTYEELEQRVKGLEKKNERLLEAFEFQETLTETAQTIILVLDTEGQIIRFNPYMEELSGYQLEEVEGLDWFGTFLPEGDYEKIRKLFQKSVINIQTKGYINPIIAKDGREILVEWYDKTLKDKDGNVLGVLAIGQDVTDRILVEEELKKIKMLLQSSLESPKDMIILSIDKDYRYLYFNTAHRNIMKQVYGADVEIGMNVLDYITIESDRENAKQSYDIALSGKPYTAIREYGDIETFYFESYYNPIYNDSNEIFGIAVFARDITARKLIEEDRNRLIKELKEALDNIKILRGLVPICASCKKIRDDKGYWRQIESYIEEHSEAQFSHSICKECSDELYGDEEWYKKSIKKDEG